MAAFLQQYISPALPVILWLFRGVTAGLAVWLLVRCCKSLFRGRVLWRQMKLELMNFRNGQNVWGRTL